MSTDNMFKLSIDLPKATELDQEPTEVKDDAFVLRNFNESYDLFNILKQQEERCERPSCLNSKDKFPSMMRSIERSIDKVNASRCSDNPPKSMQTFAEEYNQVDRARFQQKKPMLEIVPVNSEEEDCDEESSKKESATVDKKKEAYWENLRANIPSEFHNIISEMDIPAEYFTALGNITAQPEVKSDRRRRVERYLEKRRLKTWDKKICYNCRQKVAELRLRNKGRFIGRKKIFDLAGLKSRAASELKHEST